MGGAIPAGRRRRGVKSSGDKAELDSGGRYPLLLAGEEGHGADVGGGSRVAPLRQRRVRALAPGATPMRG